VNIDHQIMSFMQLCVGICIIKNMFEIVNKFYCFCFVLKKLLFEISGPLQKKSALMHCLKTFCFSFYIMRFLAENEMQNKTISQMSVYGYFCRCFEYCHYGFIYLCFETIFLILSRNNNIHF
jgi:hypothetical protein